MSCRYICDGCGKELPASFDGWKGWSKPRDWLVRVSIDRQKRFDACSHECRKKINIKSMERIEPFPAY